MDVPFDFITKSKRQEEFPLNSLERFILAHETKEVSYNSHMTVEFEGKFDSKQFEHCVRELIDETPLLRSVIKESFLGSTRYIKPKGQVQAADCIEYCNKFDQRALDDYCNRSFDLKNGPLIRFLVIQEPEVTSIVFSIHHTIGDGPAQAFLLSDLFALLRDDFVDPELRKLGFLSWQNLTTKKFGWKWYINQVMAHVRPLKRQRDYKMAGLIDYPNETSRRVTSKPLRLTPQEIEQIKSLSKRKQMSVTEFITMASVKAMNDALIKRGDLSTPIMTYVPKNMRPYFRIKKSLQNLLSTVYFVHKRGEPEAKLKGRIQKSLSNHKIEEASRFAFSTLWKFKLIPTRVLREKMTELDQDPESLTATLFVSAGRLPNDVIPPKSWRNVRVWARGVMLKSPGIGVVYTGLKGSETITVEYLEGVTRSHSISYFCERLNHHLGIHSYSEDIITSTDLDNDSGSVPRIGL